MKKIVILLLMSNLSCGTFATKNAEEKKMEIATCRITEKQSPIIVDSSKKEFSNKNLSFKYSDSKAEIENTGHKIEVKLEEKSFIILNDTKLTLSQFHFHTPSEHNLNGKIHPLEMHLVHKSYDNKYLVVSLIFKEGKDSSFLNKIIQASKQSNKNEPKTLNLTMPTQFNNKSNFYYYIGSLTTYPYIEGVDWLLKEDQMEASRYQIEYFKNLEGLNARVTQPVNDRKLLLIQNN